MKSDVNNPCIICRNHSSKKIFVTSYPDYDYPGDFVINQCTNCGLYFNSPRLSDVSIAQLYNKNYYFFHRRDEIEFKRMVAMYQHTIGIIPDHILPKTVLEIGSAKGYFLSVLKMLEWEVMGIEISKQASEFAKHKLNIPVFTGQLEEFAKNKNTQYPLVLAIDLLEHVTNPNKFVASLSSVTQSGGQVIISTPNGNSANIQVLGEA